MQDEAEQKVKIDREQANELEYVDESQKSDAAESANASNGSAGAKPVRNPEREKPKWEDKSKYEGDWKDGMRHGKGTFYYTNGDKYVGDWKDDVQDGKGSAFIVFNNSL